MDFAPLGKQKKCQVEHYAFLRWYSGSEVMAKTGKTKFVCWGAGTSKSKQKEAKIPSWNEKDHRDYVKTCKHDAGHWQ